MSVEQKQKPKRILSWAATFVGLVFALIVLSVDFRLPLVIPDPIPGASQLRRLNIMIYGVGLLMMSTAVVLVGREGRWQHPLFWAVIVVMVLLGSRAWHAVTHWETCAAITAGVDEPFILCSVQEPCTGADCLGDGIVYAPTFAHSETYRRISDSIPVAMPI